MEKEKVMQDVGFYPMGAIFNLTWDRGNGELRRQYVYLGNSVFDELPMLLDYENLKNGKKTFFDVGNADILIKDISVQIALEFENLINLEDVISGIRSF